MFVVPQKFKDHFRRRCRRGPSQLCGIIAHTGTRYSSCNAQTNRAAAKVFIAFRWLRLRNTAFTDADRTSLIFMDSISR
jgi:hypothetical protein